jgi:hypothetical protein
MAGRLDDHDEIAGVNDLARRSPTHAPDHARAASGGDGEVDLPDGGDCEGDASMRLTYQRRAACLSAVMGTTAPVSDGIALMGSDDAVVDGDSAVTANPTATKLGVKLLKHLGRDLADGHLAQRRLDVPSDVCLVLV